MAFPIVTYSMQPKVYGHKSIGLVKFSIGHYWLLEIDF